MRNIILFIAFTSLLISCSSDSNNSSNSNGNSGNNSNYLITTINPSNITSTGFSSGGNITSNNGIQAAGGICWNTSPNPIINDSFSGNTIFTNNSFISVTGPRLNPNTVYYVRAYVIGLSTTGILYGNEITITTNPIPQPVLNPNLTYGTLQDIDGNNYPTIQICNQIWMAKNLNTSRYRNGDIIPHIQDPIQWANSSIGAWCYFKNDSSNGSVYGKLYNWFAVNDARGLAPQGWHVATDNEFGILKNCQGNFNVAGCKVKESGSLHWGIYNTCSTNESGFTSIPVGERGPSGVFNGFGSIENGNLLTGTRYWTAYENFTNSNYVSLGADGSAFGGGLLDSYVGLSVRCVKD